MGGARIGGIKRYRFLNERLRVHDNELYNDAIEVGAGLRDFQPKIMILPSQQVKLKSELISLKSPDWRLFIFKLDELIAVVSIYSSFSSILAKPVRINK